MAATRASSSAPAASPIIVTIVVITGLPSASVTSLRISVITVPCDSSTESSQESKYNLSPARTGRWKRIFWSR